MRYDPVGIKGRAAAIGTGDEPAPPSPAEPENPGMQPAMKAVRLVAGQRTTSSPADRAGVDLDRRAFGWAGVVPGSPSCSVAAPRKNPWPHAVFRRAIEAAKNTVRPAGKAGPTSGEDLAAARRRLGPAEAEAEAMAWETFQVILEIEARADDAHAGFHHFLRQARRLRASGDPPRAERCAGRAVEQSKSLRRLKERLAGLGAGIARGGSRRVDEAFRFAGMKLAEMDRQAHGAGVLVQLAAIRAAGAATSLRNDREGPSVPAAARHVRFSAEPARVREYASGDDGPYTLEPLGTRMRTVTRGPAVMRDPEAVRNAERRAAFTGAAWAAPEG